MTKLQTTTLRFLHPDPPSPRRLHPGSMNPLSPNLKPFIHRRLYASTPWFQIQQARKILSHSTLDPSASQSLKITFRLIDFDINPSLNSELHNPEASGRRLSFVRRGLGFRVSRCRDFGLFLECRGDHRVVEVWGIVQSSWKSFRIHSQNFSGNHNLNFRSFESYTLTYSISFFHGAIQNSFCFFKAELFFF